MYDSQGWPVTTIAPVWGARDVVASTAGSRILAVQPDLGTITSISTSSLTVVTTYTVAPCPSHAAVSGTLLFYSYGCSGAGGINHLDLATGEVHDLAAPDIADLGSGSGVPRLGAGAGSLYALDAQSVLHGWPVTDSGLGTERSVFVPDVGRIEVRGTTVALGGSSGAVIDGPTLQTRSTLPGFAAAFGLTPDGSRAALADISTPVSVVETATGAIRGTIVVPSRSGYRHEQGRIAMSADGTLMYWLLGNYLDSPTTYALALASPQTPPQLAVRLSLYPKPGPGYSALALHGTPKRAVRITIRNPNNSVQRMDVVLDATGKAYVSFLRSWSGTVSAEILGDATHRGAVTPAAPLKIPVQIVASAMSAYKSVGGVSYFRQASSIRHSIKVSTSRPNRYLRAGLWRWTGSTWALVASQAIPLSATGRATTVVPTAVRGVRYRITYVFPGDRWNAAARTTTGPFTVG